MTDDEQLLAASATALTQLRASTGDLLAALAAVTWSDADATAPTLLPGWTRGHLLTHLARNADGIARTVSGALEQRLVPRYADGPAGRDAEIEDGATRPMSELLADVTESAERLDRVFGAVADAHAWAVVTDEQQPAWHWLEARLREVEFHRVDLADGYGADRWPAPLVARELPRAAATLPDRIETAVRVVVTADGSRAADQVGAEWRAGEGDPVEVQGPDWAVLAWLIGRPDAAEGRLSATPPLRPWC